MPTTVPARVVSPRRKGGSKTLPRLFEAAGAKFKFDYETLKPLADAVGEELDRIGD